MFQQISEFFNSIPFFSSVAFGIIAMVIVGSSWCLIGLVMGDAPKKQLDTSLVQLMSAVFGSLFAIIIMVATSDYCTSSFKVFLLTFLSYAMGGALNFVMLQFMSKAMQIGPNGVIWAIIQSALVFPFLGGVIFFDVKLSLLRGIGILCILAALVFFACGKDNSSKGSNWKLLAFIALCITGVQQNLSTLPSYFEAARGVPSIVRALSTNCGTVFAALLWNVPNLNHEYFCEIKRNFSNITFWKYIAALQMFGLLFSYILLYPGMNTMADAGMGGMCYPMMVGSCIVSFSLASVFLLKEKMRPLQFAGILICIAGLVFICTKA